MKTTNKTTTLAALAALASLALAAGSLQAAMIFQDDFTGNPDTGTDGLNGESPDTGAGTWTAGSYFDADGSFVGGGGSFGAGATLGFTPTNGLIYTLDARITSNHASNWIALGFAKGQSTGTSINNRFITGSTPQGQVWSLLRSDGIGNALTDGTSGSNIAWTSSFTGDPITNTLDVRIELDTTSGAGNWAATWYAKNTDDAGYTLVRAADSATVNEDIDSVGFGLTGAASGSLLSFSLSDNTMVPEPSTATLLALASCALILRRRR
jgi:hypothetical protein